MIWRSLSMNWDRPNSRFRRKMPDKLFLCIGERAVAQTDILPGKRGRIHFRTDWFARSLNDECIPAGTTVILLQREGTTWLVTAATEADIQSAA